VLGIALSVSNAHNRGPKGRSRQAAIPSAFLAIPFRSSGTRRSKDENKACPSIHGNRLFFLALSVWWSTCRAWMIQAPGRIRFVQIDLQVTLGGISRQRMKADRAHRGITNIPRPWRSSTYVCALFLLCVKYWPFVCNSRREIPPATTNSDIGRLRFCCDEHARVLKSRLDTTVQISHWISYRCTSIPGHAAARFIRAPAFLNFQNRSFDSFTLYFNSLSLEPVITHGWGFRES
jgi:hypothetical protein